MEGTELTDIKVIRRDDRGRPVAVTGRAASGQYHWLVRGGNGESVTLSEGYATEGNAVRGYGDMEARVYQGAM